MDHSAVEIAHLSNDPGSLAQNIFAGSIKIDRAILSQPQFKDYANKNLVLVEIDFPRRKAQSIETRKQNAELAERYQVDGFPTLVVLNSEGKAVWRYDGLYTNGLTAFLAELDKVRKS